VYFGTCSLHVDFGKSLAPIGRHPSPPLLPDGNPATAISPWRHQRPVPETSSPARCFPVSSMVRWPLFSGFPFCCLPPCCPVFCRTYSRLGSLFLYPSHLLPGFHTVFRSHHHPQSSLHPISLFFPRCRLSCSTDFFPSFLSVPPLRYLCLPDLVHITRSIFPRYSIRKRHCPTYSACVVTIHTMVFLSGICP